MSNIFARKMARKLDTEEMKLVTGAILWITRAPVANSCDPSGPGGFDFGTREDVVYSD